MTAGRCGRVKRLRKDKLREHLEETRLVDELGWAKSAGSLEDTVRAARRKVVAACENASQHGRDLPAPRGIICCARHGKKHNQL